MSLISTDEMEATATRLYPILRDWPVDGRPDRTADPHDITLLMMAGFVERVEQTKPCKTCGTPRFDYAYFRVTGGGQLFVAAMEKAA